MSEPTSDPLFIIYPKFANEEDSAFFGDLRKEDATVVPQKGYDLCEVELKLWCHWRFNVKKHKVVSRVTLGQNTIDYPPEYTVERGVEPDVFDKYPVPDYIITDSKIQPFGKVEYKITATTGPDNEELTYWGGDAGYVTLIVKGVPYVIPVIDTLSFVGSDNPDGNFGDIDAVTGVSISGTEIVLNAKYGVNDDDNEASVEITITAEDTYYDYEDAE